jgi:O-antigen/teichoic acid export membrane protein
LSIINLIKLLQLITTFTFSRSIFFGVFFSRKEFYELSVSSVKLGVLNFMGTLIGYVDKLILPMILSASIIAPYYLVNDISSKLWLLPGAIFSALFPSLMKFPEKFSNKSFLKKINRILIFSFAPVIIIVSGFSDEIIEILSSGTLDTTTSIYLKITLVGVLISCFNQLNSNILIAYNRENEMIKFQTILFLIYLPVLYFSVQFYGLFGACYAFSIRLLIDSVIISILSFKHTKYYFKIESLFVLLSIFILVFGVVLKNSIFNSIILIISCFIFIYYLKKSWRELIIAN